LCNDLEVNDLKKSIFWKNPADKGTRIFIGKKIFTQKVIDNLSENSMK